MVATQGAKIQLALSSLVTYLLLVALVVFAVVAAYILKIVPSYLGAIGLGTGLTGIFAFFVHDLTAAHIPDGWPAWTTFAVVTVASAFYAGAGVFTAQTLVTTAAALTWIIYVVTFALNYVSENGPGPLSPGTEATVIAILGAVVSWLLAANGQQPAALGGVTVTVLTALPMYVHAKEAPPLKTT